MTQPELENAAASIAQIIGLDPASIGMDMVIKHITRRMLATKTSAPDSYIRLLLCTDAERALLIEELISRETWFFRDQQPFACLRNFVQAQAPLAGGRRLRILSAPCATGEEPYSIALTLLEAGLTPEQFHILAVDISTIALDTAHRAIYRQASFRGVRPDIRDRFFRTVPGGFLLHKDIADLVTFQKSDMLSPAFLLDIPPFHVVFCRNFLIYLRDETRMLIAATLNRLLAANALLFTGHSELAFFIQLGYAPHPHSGSFALAGLPKNSSLPTTSKRDAPPTPHPLFASGAKQAL